MFSNVFPKMKDLADLGSLQKFLLFSGTQCGHYKLEQQLLPQCSQGFSVLGLPELCDNCDVMRLDDTKKTTRNIGK